MLRSFVWPLALLASSGCSFLFESPSTAGEAGGDGGQPFSDAAAACELLFESNFATDQNQDWAVGGDVNWLAGQPLQIECSAEIQFSSARLSSYPLAGLQVTLEVEDIVGTYAENSYAAAAFQLRVANDESRAYEMYVSTSQLWSRAIDGEDTYACEGCQVLLPNTVAKLRMRALRENRLDFSAWIAGEWRDVGSVPLSSEGQQVIPRLSAYCEDDGIARLHATAFKVERCSLE